MKYASGEDLSLQRHMDMSDVTLNVNLGKTYTGDESTCKLEVSVRLA